MASGRHASGRLAAQVSLLWEPIQVLRLFEMPTPLHSRLLRLCCFEDLTGAVREHFCTSLGKAHIPILTMQRLELLPPVFAVRAAIMFQSSLGRCLSRSGRACIPNLDGSRRTSDSPVPSGLLATQALLQGGGLNMSHAQ